MNLLHMLWLDMKLTMVLQVANSSFSIILTCIRTPCLSRVILKRRLFQKTIRDAFTEFEVLVPTFRHSHYSCPDISNDVDHASPSCLHESISVCLLNGFEYPRAGKLLKKVLIDRFNLGSFDNLSI